MNDEPSLTSDHALILSAIWRKKCVLAAGGVVVYGLKTTELYRPLRLDEYGCPRLTPELREALQEVMRIILS